MNKHWQGEVCIIESALAPSQLCQDSILFNYCQYTHQVGAVEGEGLPGEEFGTVSWGI